MDLRSTPLTNIASVSLSTKFDTMPVCIVQREHILQWQIIFNYWNTCGQQFIAIHLSDEFNSDPVEWYSLSNCKGIIRNYKRPNLPADEKVVTVPLGPAINRAVINPSVLPNLQDRNLIWSFEGTQWSNRKEKLQPLIDLKLPSKVTFHEKWNAANYSVDDYITTLNASKFIPCLPGTNFETYRFYEALEHKCIPVICREPNDDIYFNWIHTNLPGIFAIPNWSEAGTFINMINKNQIVMQIYCDTIYTQWLAWKETCRAACRKMLE